MKMSVDIEADEWRRPVTVEPKPRDKVRLGRASKPLGRNAQYARAGLESEIADADPTLKWGRPRKPGSDRRLYRFGSPG